MDALRIQRDGCYVDCTAGGGGHSSAILSRLGAGGRLLSLDKDPEARAETNRRLLAVETQAEFEVVASDFRHLKSVLEERGIPAVDGILADLGVSSHQLDVAERGFSLRAQGPLDMRMNPERGETAAGLVNRLLEAELAELFFAFGEERYSRRIAAQIVRTRVEKPLQTTEDLIQCVLRAIPAAARREKQHPAKRVFQALRIAVNGELEALDALLQSALPCLNPGGRLAILTFHSLEDRRVKQAFRKWEHPCTCPPNLPCVCGLLPLGRACPARGVTAGAEEIARNPRAHSARLRVFEKGAEI